MSEEIREAFEKEFVIQDYLTYDCGAYRVLHGITSTRARIEKSEILNNKLKGFQAGHNSRDEEVQMLKVENKKLREELSKKSPVKCPDCNTPIEMFDADNDWCPVCKIYKPAGEYDKQALTQSVKSTWDLLPEDKEALKDGG